MRPARGGHAETPSPHLPRPVRRTIPNGHAPALLLTIAQIRPFTTIPSRSSSTMSTILNPCVPSQREHPEVPTVRSRKPKTFSREQMAKLPETRIKHYGSWNGIPRTLSKEQVLDELFPNKNTRITRRGNDRKRNAVRPMSLQQEVLEGRIMKQHKTIPEVEDWRWQKYEVKRYAKTWERRQERQRRMRRSVASRPLSQTESVFQGGRYAGAHISGPSRLRSKASRVGLATAASTKPALTKTKNPLRVLLRVMKFVPFIRKSSKKTKSSTHRHSL
ncbi:hypothetical protein EIP91_000690 [Steccherinum ochraceum]|uniref:Uncharacterized protein n=1 Tax=Steccherinum ochraceum TaxID=92696 RepID=A0A4R0RFH7_9APHY|nr:hypothetical protein EIP91_000690 [Steccherinum ochraceum]